MSLPIAAIHGSRWSTLHSTLFALLELTLRSTVQLALRTPLCPQQNCPVYTSGESKARFSSHYDGYSDSMRLLETASNLLHGSVQGVEGTQALRCSTMFFNLPHTPPPCMRDAQMRFTRAAYVGHPIIRER